MNCNHAWDQSFLHKNFSKTWCQTTYKNHQKQMVLAVEKTWFPSTMPFVEVYRQVISAETAYKQHPNHAKITALKGKKDPIVNQYKKELIEQGFMVADLKDNYERMLRKGIVSSSITTIHKPCIRTVCRGYLTPEWKCGVCDTQVCKTCHAENNIQHACKQHDVDSVRAISKETRPCPKCATPIFRSMGCSHMWCTQCHTGFDWDTLRILSNHENTNPHFYQWYFSQSPSTQQNTELPTSFYTVQEIVEYMRAIQTLRNDTSGEWLAFITLLRQVQHIAENGTISVDHFNEKVNLAHRVKYLVGEIDEKRFTIEAMSGYKLTMYRLENAEIRLRFSSVLQAWLEEIRTVFTSTRIHPVSYLQWFSNPDGQAKLAKLYKAFDMYYEEKRTLAKQYSYTSYGAWKVSQTKTFANKAYAIQWDEKSIKV